MQQRIWYVFGRAFGGMKTRVGDEERVSKARSGDGDGNATERGVVVDRGRGWEAEVDASGLMARSRLATSRHG